MANATYNGIIYADTVGILSKIPICVRAIQFYPNAVSDVLDLNFWDEGNPITATHLVMTATASTGTVTDDDATRNVLTSAFADGAVVKVLSGSGSAANKTYHLIGTAGNNDRFIVTPTASWGDEANKFYEIVAYPQRPFFNALQPGAATTHHSLFHYFGGVELPNLVLETISTSAYALIYTD
jgi:hypothetical protein